MITDGLAAVASAASGRSVFSVEFADGAGLRQRESLSACVNVAFESVAPVRGFRWSKGLGSFAGWWWSSTMDRHVGFESWLERDHVMLLDFDAEVAAFSSQPFWLCWGGLDRARRHAPDFFVRRADGTAVVIDVRADERIEPADAEVFDATARACADVGWGFRRMGVEEPTRVANVRWLSRYRHPRCGARPGVAERLVGAFSRPRPLFDGVAEIGDRIAVLPVLYHLLWCGLLEADLSTALHPATVVGRRMGAR
jgi:hypothetical protein